MNNSIKQLGLKVIKFHSTKTELQTLHLSILYILWNYLQMLFSS